MNQKAAILRTTIEYGGQTEYNFALRQYKMKNDTSFLTAMCASKDSSTLSGWLLLLSII